MGDPDAADLVGEIEGGKGGRHPTDRVGLRVARSADAGKKDQGDPLFTQIAGRLVLEEVMSLAEGIDEAGPEGIFPLHVVVIARQHRDDTLETGEDRGSLAHETFRDAGCVEEIARDHEDLAGTFLREGDHRAEALEAACDEAVAQGRRISAAGEFQAEVEVGGVEEADHAFVRGVSG